MKHTLYKCPPTCEGCAICNGGLQSCTVCKGGEGSLPTECPGVALGEFVQDDIYNRRLDFVGGQWRRPCDTCKRMASLIDGECADCRR